ncbi:MAG: hypothetical protein H6737_10040 [Alphaproteobacteria bacterium]|nr:hypothetical protein [Alphaproteobacteria bacterium]
MNVLGIGDGPDAGAALAIDDRIVAAEPQAAFDNAPRSRAFPWDAIDDVLRRHRVEPGDVQEIAVAGRFTPPFFLRRRPGLRRVARDAFSVALDLTVFYQAMLRQSGLGALEADRTAEWMEKQFRKAGFRSRIVLVDIHTALANVAYRDQPEDDVLIVTLHPMGDGVSLAVHHGLNGQIDRLFEQKGFSSLHVHMRRCAATLGFADARAMWAAAGPEADPGMVAQLARSLRPLDGRLSRNSYPFPERAVSYEALRRLPVEVAAASVLENLSAAVRGVVAWHVRRYPQRKLVVAGEVFEATRIVSALLDIEGVDYVSCPSEPGFGALAWGAAAYVAGVAMKPATRFGADDFSALGGEPLDWAKVAAVLAKGGRVAVFSGQSGMHAWDDRCVWARGDRGVYVPGQRVLWDEGAGGPGSVPAGLHPALAAGSAAVRMSDAFHAESPSAASPDGYVRLVPVSEGPAMEVFAHLRAEGVRTLRSTRLLQGACPVASGADALAAARTAGADLLVAGTWQVTP